MKMTKKMIEKEYHNTSRSGNALLIIVLLILAIIIGGVAYYFGVLAKPVNIYKNIVASLVDGLFEDTIQESNSKGVQSVNFDVDLTLELDDEKMQENPIVKALNAIDMLLNVQADNNTNNYVVHLNSTYDNEKLLNASVFMNQKDSKTYIYAKELLDKYLEVELDEIQGVELEGANQIAPSKKIKSIIKKELKNIITEEMCYKDDGAYVLRTTNIELFQNIVKAIESLSKNEEFLEENANPEEAKEILESYIEAFDTTSMDTYTLEIILDDLDLLLRPKKVTAKVGGFVSLEVAIVIEDDNTKFDVKVQDKQVAQGNLTVNEKANEDVIKIDIDIADLGRIVLDMKASHKAIKEIDKIDSYKVTKIEELTMNDTMELMENLQESKLGEVISEIEDYNQSIIDKANAAVEASNLAELRSAVALEYMQLYVDYLDGAQGAVKLNAANVAKDEQIKELLEELNDNTSGKVYSIVDATNGGVMVHVVDKHGNVVQDD